MWCVGTCGEFGVHDTGAVQASKDWSSPVSQRFMSHYGMLCPLTAYFPSLPASHTARTSCRPCSNSNPKPYSNSKCSNTIPTLICVPGLNCKPGWPWWGAGRHHTHTHATLHTPHASLIGPSWPWWGAQKSSVCVWRMCCVSSIWCVWCEWCVVGYAVCRSVCVCVCKAAFLHSP